MDGQSAVTVVMAGQSGPGLSTVQLIGLISSLVLGLGNLAWTLYLSRKSRLRSVEDDFWFRKVIAPEVIDRVLGFSSKWSGALSVASDLGGKKDDALARINECKSEAATIVVSCFCLKLYGNELYKNSTNCIDAMVDQVTICYHAISSPGITNGDADKFGSASCNELGKQLLALLTFMKNLQRSF